jgi:hypothetical protein
MATDLTRSMFGFDPICVHPWNPWLKQAFHSISTCQPPPILEELLFHDVIVVKSRHPLETWKNPLSQFASLITNNLRISSGKALRLSGNWTWDSIYPNSPVLVRSESRRHRFLSSRRADLKRIGGVEQCHQVLHGGHPLAHRD